MKYVALLRGVNVGGNGMIKMSEIKSEFEKSGYTNVSTYINSGNILFESPEKDMHQLANHIENMLEKKFFAITTAVFSLDEIDKILKNVPKSWKSDDLRKYIAFITNPATPEDVIKEVQLKEGIDAIEKGHRVVYMSTKMDGLTKSNFSKLSAKKIYKNMTIRNYTTVTKLLALMEKDTNIII